MQNLRSILFLWLLLAAPTLWASDVHISVFKSGGADVVEGSFWVQADSSALWNVLTEYDKLPQFVPALITSHVKERQGDRVLLEQQARAKFLFTSRTVNLTLEIVERPYEEISFNDVSHRDFDFYRGLWQIEEAPWGLDVFYTLEAQPNFHVPAMIARHILKENTLAMLKEIRKEILRRAKGN